MKDAENILLTGGAGFIGSHTAIDLIQNGFNVFIYDDFSNSNKDVLDSIKRITGIAPKLIEGDIRDYEKLSHFFSKTKIHSVIHFAGLKAVGDSVIKPLEYYDNNIVGTISLLNAMRENGVNKIIFSSSATVYGDPEYLPIDENHKTSSTNPYGRTKLFIEEILQDIVNSETFFSAICLRYFNPIGAHNSGFIGESPKDRPNNIMPIINKVCFGLQKKLYIFGKDYDTHDGTGVRDYIHVVDIARGHRYALALLEKNPGWEAINLGTGKGFSVLDLINYYEKASGRKIPYEYIGRRQGDVASCFAKVDKAKQLLKWEADFNINEMCLSSHKAYFNCLIK